MNYHRPANLTPCLIFIIIAFNLKPLYAQPETVFNKYSQALIAEEWDRAESYWLTSDIEKSKRLGITFTNIKAKYDCASPLINALNDIRQGDVQINTTKTVVDDHLVKLSVQLTTYDDTITTFYYLVESNGRWWLCSALYALTQNWGMKQTRFANVYFSDISLINDFALEKLDCFVESLGQQLDIPRNRMKYLEQAKIDYYLCNQQQIEKLTGYSAHGMTNLQFDAIISQHLPHAHEMVHLILNYALEELPLYTIPFLQEGVACYYGGRWGKSPSVIFYWGNVSLGLNLASLNDILTYDGFHSGIGNPDISYALSSLFVKTLIERFGIQRLKTFYLELSGKSSFVCSLTLEDVKTKATETFKTPWMEIEKSFAETVNQYKFCGIIPQKKPLAEPLLKLTSKNLTAHIHDLGNIYFFEIKTKPDIIDGVILLKNKSSPINPNYKSRLFSEHLSSAPYNGEMFGIQFSSSDVGLYNYYTNILLAKYVLGFTSSDEYWNQEEQVITFSLKKSILNQNITNFQLRLVEP